ncbi:inositol monophosphatase [bacterium]|nr:inositol monophosphatase [bacterium]
MYNKELKIAKLAAREAGKYLGKEFLLWSRGKARYKTNRELVTKCDKQAEKIIFSHIKKHFPDYAILSEESGKQDKPSNYMWVVDPLDATTNFTIHHPLFATSISLLHKNEVVVAVTYGPILDEMYWATKNGGAFKNNKKLSIAPYKPLNKTILSYNHGRGLSNTKKSFKIYQHFHLKAFKCRNMQCTSLQTAMVAAGSIDGYVVSGAKLWDVAAGILLIKEAGGLVTDWKNRPWNKNSKNILAAEAKIHSTCLKELRKIGLA